MSTPKASRSPSRSPRSNNTKTNGTKTNGTQANGTKTNGTKSKSTTANAAQAQAPAPDQPAAGSSAPISPTTPQPITPDLNPASDPSDPNLTVNLDNASSHPQSDTQDMTTTPASTPEADHTPNPDETTEITPRPVLDLQPSRTRALSFAGKRPIDPSPVQVSYTVSLAGTRPVMRNTVNPAQQPINFKKTPYVMNRPIAPNTTEDSTKMLEYLD